MVRNESYPSCCSFDCCFSSYWLCMSSRLEFDKNLFLSIPPFLNFDVDGCFFSIAFGTSTRSERGAGC